MTFNVEILSATQSECDEGLLIEYTEVYMGDDATKTAKMVLRNDDEPAQGCGNPFVTPPLPSPLGMARQFLHRPWTQISPRQRSYRAARTTRGKGFWLLVRHDCPLP